MKTTAKLATRCEYDTPFEPCGADMTGVQSDFFSDIMDNVNDALFTVDTEMTITSYNRVSELMTGVSRQQALGQKCYQVFKTSLCVSSCPVKEALQTKQKVVTREIVMQDGLGVRMPVLMRAAALHDAQGKLVGAVESIRCLRRLYTIMDSVADGLFTVNNNMEITNFNRAAEELTGIPHQQALGMQCKDVFKTNCCNGACPIQEAMQTGQPVQRDIEMTGRDGVKKLVSSNASVLFDCAGLALGGVETLRDMTPIVAMREEIRQKYTFRRLVSRNVAMRRMFDIMEDVASSEATVFIHGESGTGKELLAHAIHDLSSRRNGPLVTVNCGALPETLLESEIFGVRKGAFTGATENRPGRIEQCQGGTFFLDEVGDLPLQLQVKLLRLLENREYQPLGARHSIKANVRFVTASHRNLEEMVRNGTFRQDLYFRINIITLNVPPLRERVDDIPLLIDMALQRFNLTYGKRVREVSPELLESFFSYPFPGNVRELLNIMEQAVILCRGQRITLEHMPHYFKSAKASLAMTAPAKAALPAAAGKLDPDQIALLLDRYNGNRSAVAGELGVDRTTLWRWMSRYGMLDTAGKQTVAAIN